MRLLLFTLLGWFYAVAEPAHAVILSVGESTQVYGPFITDDAVFVDATIYFQSNFDPSTYPNPPYKFSYAGSGTIYGATISTCLSGFGGPCSPYSPNATFPIFGNSPPITFLLDSFTGGIFDTQTDNFVFPGGSLGTFYVDLEFDDSYNHNGFSFGAPAVPEPSTWAMLLIGFAAIWFVGYRKSRRENFIAKLPPLLLRFQNQTK